MADLVDPEQDPADEMPHMLRAPVSRIGDIWALGPHRLLCGDARERRRFAKAHAADIGGHGLHRSAL